MTKQEHVQKLKVIRDGLSSYLKPEYSEPKQEALNWAIALAEQLDDSQEVAALKECEVKYLGYIPNQGNTWQCSCGYWETVDANDIYENGVLKNLPPKSSMFKYSYCRNCGGVLKEGK